MSDDLSATIDQVKEACAWADNLHHESAVVSVIGLAALLSAIEEARAALKPFVREADEWSDDIPDTYLSANSYARPDFTVGQYRAARAAFERLGGKL